MTVSIRTYFQCSTKDWLKYLLRIHLADQKWKENIPEIRKHFLKVTGGKLIRFFEMDIWFGYLDEFFDFDQNFEEPETKWGFSWNPEKYDDLVWENFDKPTISDSCRLDEEFGSQIRYFALEALLQFQIEEGNIEPYLDSFRGIQFLTIQGETAKICLSITSEESNNLNFVYQNIPDKISIFKQPIGKIEIITEVKYFQ